MNEHAHSYRDETPKEFHALSGQAMRAMGVVLGTLELSEVKAGRYWAERWLRSRATRRGNVKPVFVPGFEQLTKVSQSVSIEGRQTSSKSTVPDSCAPAVVEHTLGDSLRPQSGRVLLPPNPTPSIERRLRSSSPMLLDYTAPRLAKQMLRDSPSPEGVQQVPGGSLVIRTLCHSTSVTPGQPHHPMTTLRTPLSPAEEKYVDRCLKDSGFTSKVGREQLGSSDIQRLAPRQWLNDEIVNFYGALIMARQGTQAGVLGKPKLLDIFYFSTFFWVKLTRDGYMAGSLGRWTDRAGVDIFAKDLVLIPVNQDGHHWSCAAINFRKRRFECYDSMGRMKANATVFKTLRSYVAEEHLSKKGTPFSFAGWENYAPGDIPRQNNDCDCGIFTCQFMESLSRGVEAFTFKQQDMPRLRRQMIWEIGHSELRYRGDS